MSATVLPFRPRTLVLPPREPTLAAIAAAFVPSAEWTRTLYDEFLARHPELAAEPDDFVDDPARGFKL